jgi:exopolysaccharide biosynthesis polyprenyl glycosylphosphotransferase
MGSPLPRAEAPHPEAPVSPQLTPVAAPPPLEKSALSPGFAAKLNVAVDLVLLLGALYASSLLGGHAHPFTLQFWWLGLAAVCVWAVTGTALCLYDSRFAERDTLDVVALITVNVMAVVTVLALVGLAVPAATAMPRVGHFLLLFWPTALALRLFVFRPVAGQERPEDEVVILGTGPLGRATAEDLLKRGRRRLVGFVRFADDPAVQELAAPVLGTVEELERVLRTLPVSAVYVAGNALRQGAAMQSAVKVCERFGVPFALPAHSFRLDRARPVETQAVSDGYLHFSAVASKPHQMAMKRLFDILVSAVALWMLLPVFAVVALAIKLTSRGPILFKQLRVGQHGRPFHMLKFRSMVVNAEELKAKLAAQNEMTGPVFKMKNDPRITRVGRFIRKYSIDELPQFINVLRGEMSIVGPRPPVPSEVAKYETWQRRRLSVRPGLTCIWQVSGRNQISFEEWMYLDMQYIDHWSLKDDLALLLRTVPVVITGRGAS